MTEEKRKQSDAEATVKHAILSGLIQNWHKKDETNWVEITQQEIFNKIFDPCMKWAAKEYLQEIENQPAIQ